MKYLNTVFVFWLAMVVHLVYTEPKVEIRGPTYFTTDGTRDLTLNATATSLGAGLYYAWGGLCSSNTDTCTFRPRHDQDGGQVICTAANPATKQSVAAKYVLKLNCPPVEPPRIMKRTSRDVLTPGDVLTCTVTGGKPLVTSVNFTCTNLSLSDQNDVTDTYSVSSSVTVVARGATEGPMVCTCFAIWSPEPALYQKEQTMAYTVQMPSSTYKPSSPTNRNTQRTDITTSHTGGKTSPTNDRTSSTDAADNTVVIAVILCLLILGLIVAIAVIIIVHRRKTRNRAQDTDKTPIPALSKDQNKKQGRKEKSNNLQVPASTGPEAESGADTQPNNVLVDPFPIAKAPSQTPLSRKRPQTVPAFHSSNHIISATKSP